MSQSLPQLVLASASPFRKELLQRLHVPFLAKAPPIDEDALKSGWSNPLELAINLGRLKAESLASPDNVVIGGDQLVSLENQVLGKPHTKENAISQLQNMRGKTHDLITAVTVIAHGKQVFPILNITKLSMRHLTDQEIINYVELDLPLSSAGAYKIEGIGIALFEKIETTDFTAIVGLPLIELSETLRKIGYTIP